MKLPLTSFFEDKHVQRVLISASISFMLVAPVLSLTDYKKDTVENRLETALQDPRIGNKNFIKAVNFKIDTQHNTELSDMGISIKVVPTSSTPHMRIYYAAPTIKDNHYRECWKVSKVLDTETNAYKLSQDCLNTVVYDYATKKLKINPDNYGNKDFQEFCKYYNLYYNRYANTNRRKHTSEDELNEMWAKCNQAREACMSELFPTTDVKQPLNQVVVEKCYQLQDTTHTVELKNVQPSTISLSR